ncbi:MAG TPA: hypothetical protein VGI70_05135, partial [Polyangiales bacterium]
MSPDAQLASLEVSTSRSRDRARRRRAAWARVVALSTCTAACGGANSSELQTPTILAAGASANPIAGQNALVGASGANGGAPALGRPAADGGRHADAGSGGQATMAMAGVMAGASAGSGGVAASAGAGGSATTDEHDDCADGVPVDARDAMLPSVPDQWKSPANGAIDLIVPKLVLDWMGERMWEPSHDAWHNIRRCNGASMSAFGGAMSAICTQHPELIPTHQECTDAEDGFEFLVVHRHMIIALKQAFPQHAALFAAFPHFPFDATDVPVEWQDRWGSGWSASIKQTAMTLENIESNLAQFPTEGDLGKFIQCGGMSNGASSIHGALHFKWVVNDSPYSLGKQSVNIDNYMFWKLHGWIDDVWERYRVATGLTPSDPKLKGALTEQC